VTFVDGRSLADGEALDADVAVVGAGAAGITLALSLGQAGVRVVVVESGDRDPTTETQLLYRGDNVGLPYFDLVSARLRYFGGSTNHWSGTCRPFSAFDLARHDWDPMSGWPIGLDDLEPFYPRAAELCGLPSEEWGTQTWADRSPYPVLPLDPARVETRVAQNVRARQRRFAPNYADDLEGARGVTVLLNSNVVELRLDDARATITALRVRTLAGREFEVRAPLHVVACGGLETPRLLLASNRQIAAGIGNARDRVGRYFLEHPRFIAGFFAPFDDQLDPRFYATHDAAPSRITGYLAIPERVREREQLQDVQFRLEPRYPAFYRDAMSSDDVAALRRLAGRGEEDGDMVADLERVVDDLTSWRHHVALGAPLPVPLPEVAASVLDEKARSTIIPDVFGDIATVVYGEAIATIPTEGIDVVARVEPVPHADSRVRLGAARDVLGMPILELDWRLSEQDRDSVRRALDLLGTELGRAGLGRMRALDLADQGWPDDLAGGWHHMGTTRMADDPAMGVVDGDCRVHGTSNLYIAGSSVFATASSATPTLTLVALALRLADHLVHEISS
jgi:choline dehydrogenase-like flavoprotein